jgi:hypothetical protein
MNSCTTGVSVRFLNDMIPTSQGGIDKVTGSTLRYGGHGALRARLADLGQEIFPREQQTPEALAALQKAEIEKWWPLIKEAGIKLKAE